MPFTTNSFLSTLDQKAGKSGGKNFEKKKPVEKIFLNNKNTFGRYQVLPMNCVISDYPYVFCNGTREVYMPRTITKKDGTQETYSAWIRLLPKSAYSIKDPSSGLEVSSLTASDESLLNQAYEIFDQLYLELDAKNQVSNPTVYNFIRRKNYTLFHGYCVNMWTVDNARKPARQNFSALFVMTSKAFRTKLEDNINDTAITSGMSDEGWMDKIYNNKLRDREGYLMFSVSKASTPGFNISVTHQLNAKDYLAGVEIPEEDAEMMQNPIESFLGWQANYDGDNPVEQHHLFNARLIKEVVEYMTTQLAHIRMAKQSNSSIADAIDSTNKMITSAATNQPKTVDPVLNAQNQDVQAGNYNTAQDPGKVVSRNDEPMNTPPAAHMNPITGQPEPDHSNFGKSPVEQQQNNGSVPFNKPSFAASGDLPF